MLVHALITSVRASPEPAILLVLHRLDKVLADLVGGRTRVTVLAQHDTAQLLLVPLVHSIRLLLLLLVLTRIGVEILLGRFALDVHVVTELALPTLVAAALLVEDTQNGLGVDTERHLLHLDRLEQLGSFTLGQLGGSLLGLALLPLCFLLLLIGGLVGCGHRIHLLDLLFGSSTFFLLVGVSYRRPGSGGLVMREGVRIF